MSSSSEKCGKGQCFAPAVYVLVVRQCLYEKHAVTHPVLQKHG